MAWLLMCLVSVIVSACSEPGDYKPAEHQPVASISITPAQLTLQTGQSVQLTAVVGDAAGNALPQRSASLSIAGDSSTTPSSTIADRTGRSGISIVWSATPGITRIDERGMLTAEAAGTATVTVAAEGTTGSTIVNVMSSEPEPILVTPVRASIAIGDSLQLIATPMDSTDPEMGEAVVWYSEDPSRLMVSETGFVTGVAAGTTMVQATRGPDSYSATITVSDSPEIRGLDFPGSATVNDTMRFEFNSPMGPYPATYIWRAYPRQQRSYYTAFFWGNGGEFYPDNTYYGFHPYPDWDSVSRHFWEIAAPPGKDIVSSDDVIYDRWYLQVVVCSEVDGVRVEEFYWDWPDTTKVLRHESASFPEPPDPVLVVGDAPWNPGKEVWNGVLRGFQFYDAALSMDELQREIAMPGSARTPWYLNVNPTPSDIADKSLSGNDPVWMSPSRPSLWIGRQRAGHTIQTTVRRR